MNYQKFLSDIAKINYSTQELATQVKNIIYTSIRSELISEMTLLQTQLSALPTETKSEKKPLDAYKKSLQERHDALSNKIAKVSEKISSSTSSNINANFITEFAKAFRNVKHLQRVLLNAPKRIKKYEADFILALLENLSPQELQTQLETLSQADLQNLVSSSIESYKRAEDEGNQQLLQRAQNLAQIATVIMIKRECQNTIRNKSQIPENDYVNLVNNLSTLIPDVKSSTIFDNINACQVFVRPDQPDLKTNISNILYDTQRNLGLNDLPWHDDRQLKIMLPSRELYQKLRFGQEDRRIYNEIRRKNLQNDLFMARNIYDIKQFTQDNTSDAEFASLEEQIYDRKVKEEIKKTQNNDIQFYNTYYDKPGVYARSEHYKQKFTDYSQNTSAISVKISKINEKLRQVREIQNQIIKIKKQIREVGTTLRNTTNVKVRQTLQKQGQELEQQSQLLQQQLDALPALEQLEQELPQLQQQLKNLAKEKEWAEEFIRKIKRYNKLKTDVGTASDARNVTKQDLLKSSYTILNLEKIFINSAGANANIPCPEPYITINKITGEITVELNYFPELNAAELSSEMKDTGKYPVGMNIETKVTSFISEHGGTSVKRATFTGKSLEEIEQAIRADSVFGQYPKALIKFQAAMRKIKAPIPKAKTAVTDLKFTDNMNEARLRALLELKKFHTLYREKKPSTQLSALFEKINAGAYNEAFQTAEIDKTIKDSFIAISELAEATIPPSCKKTYAKAGKIVNSSTQRQTASAQLNYALDSRNFSDSQTQKEAIAKVFKDEYVSAIATEALGKKQSKTVISDIDKMADEYIDFSNRTEMGEFSIDYDTEIVYVQALAQIAMQLRGKEGEIGDLNQITFKLSHKIQPGIETPIKITGVRGKPLTVFVNLTKKLPYSLNKTAGSNHLFISYGGSRGTVAQLEKTEKGRYFTNWRVYGVGQYGTVKRCDDFISGEGLVIKEGFVEPDPAPICYTILKDFDVSSYEPNDARKRSLHKIIGFYRDLLAEPDDLNIQTLQENAEQAQKLYEFMDNRNYRNDIHGKEIDMFLGTNIRWIAQLKEESVPYKCKKTFVKAVNIAPSLSTYPEELRQDPLYRDITSRDDPNSGTERTVLEAIAAAKQEVDPSINVTTRTEYTTFEGKLKPIYVPGVIPIRYKMIQPLAKGLSYKDMTDSYLNNHSKGSIAHHRPATNQGLMADLNDALALSTAIVDVANFYRNLGFSHNDLKPENFMALKKPEGTYLVDFIDRATGGFKRPYVPSEGEIIEPIKLFAKLFGCAPKKSVLRSDGATEWSTDNGSFLAIKDQRIIYGINPSLEILHGRRNCTLPYISPNAVLEKKEDGDFKYTSKPAQTFDPNLNTHFEASTPEMDDWALTALIFGLCNRKAYFLLSEGRAVNDYTVPDIIGTDGNKLEILDFAKFNEFFSPIPQDQINTIEDLDNPHAVMSIPSTKREGQPIHLWQRLKELTLLTNTDPEIKKRINKVLKTVYESVADGSGLNIQKLQIQLQEANACIQAIEQQEAVKKKLFKEQLLNEVIEKFSEDFSENELLSNPSTEPNKKNIEILCTYPTGKPASEFEQSSMDKAEEILQKIDNSWLQRKVFDGGTAAPLRNLLQQTISHNQPQILGLLLNKLRSHPQLKVLIQEQGLLLYALQQGMTDSANELIKTSGLTPDNIFDLMLTSYKPGADHSYITWHANALHAAIRNNNQAQLELILKYLPKETASTNGTIRSAIKEALYLSADLLNRSFYERILNEYNSKNPNHIINTIEILNLRHPTLGTCPYHFFLSSETSSKAIPWTELEEMAQNPQTKVFVNSFLTQYPHPAVIAGESNNFNGLLKLLELAHTPELLSAMESQALLLERDEQGLNLLNHVLNSGNLNIIFKFLSELEQQPCMQDNAEVLHLLLNNPAPNNPLRSFLALKIPPSNKYTVITTLIEALSHEPNNENQQRQIRNLLIVNSDWLIKESTNLQNRRMLEQLLDSNNLTMSTKLSLFDSLRQSAEQQQNAVAQAYFLDKYRANIPSPQKDVTPTVALDFQPKDDFEIRMQRDGDLKKALAELLANNSAYYEKLREASLKDIDRLKEENIKLTRSVQSLTEQNEEWKRSSLTTADIIEKLTQEKQEIEAARDEIRSMIVQLDVNYKSDLKKLQLQYQEEQEALISEKNKLTEKHNADLEELTNKLELAEQKVLTIHTEVERLESELGRANDLYQTTQKELDLAREKLKTSAQTLSDKEQANLMLELTIVELRLEIEKLSNELKAKSLEATALETALTEKNLAYQQLGKESSVEKDGLNEEIIRLREAIQEKELTISQVSSQLIQSKNSFKTLQDQYDDLGLRNSELEDSFAKLEKKLETTISEAQNRELELQLQIQSLQDVVKGLRLGIENIERQLTEEKLISTELTKELAAKKLELEALQTAKQLSGQESLVLQQQLQDRIRELTDQVKEKLQANQT
ncbi:MAG: hypothetical protein ACO1N3_03770, partial [Gammaproteobacteria bacterium]